MAIIIGLDISSTTIGFSIIKEENGLFSLIDYFYYQPKKTLTLFQNLVKVKKWLREKSEGVNPDYIAIENISEHFTTSTSKTIIKLAVYNRVVGLEMFEIFGKEPFLLNVNTIRATIKPKDVSERLSKIDVPEALEKILNITFPWVYMKNGNIAETSYDLADSIATAVGLRMLQLYNPKKLLPKKKKKKVKKDLTTTPATTKVSKRIKISK